MARDKTIEAEYQPNTYARRNNDGTYIPHAQRAQKTAEYFSREQWGKKRQSTDTTREEKPITEKVDYCTNAAKEYNTEDITLEEIKEVVKKLKRRKAPGPDEIPAEIFKELNEECLKGILTLLNQWWTTEDIPEETLRARVVLIFKKGDSGLYENYRPISLLNSLYKIYTAIIQKKLSSTLDKY